MRRIVLICAALIASLAMTISASARLGMAPLNAEDGSLIQIKGGHGHGHGHHGHRGGRGQVLFWKALPLGRSPTQRKMLKMKPEVTAREKGQ
jgi:Spy/CpxP family protein refolding chaperone